VTFDLDGRELPEMTRRGPVEVLIIDTTQGFPGREYPQPRVNDGRRKLWLRDDLDQAILPPDLQRVRDVAEDL
jgi:hypothetical protein